MSDTKPRRGITPAILALVVAGILAAGYLIGTSREPSTPANRAEPETPIPNEYWKCLACVRVPGKGYHQCKSVMGKGDELGARERAKLRACQAAEAPLDECQIIGEIQCEQLEEAEVVGARGQPKVRIVAPPESP